MTPTFYEELPPAPYPIAHGAVSVWGTPILHSSLFHFVACSLVNTATVSHVNTRHRDPSGAGFDSFIDMDETVEATQ